MSPRPHVDEGSGVPNLNLYDATTFVQTALPNNGWCFDAPYGGRVSAAWNDEPSYDGSVVNDYDMFLVSSSQSRSDVGHGQTRADLDLLIGPQRLVLRLDSVTGDQPYVDLAVVGTILDWTECDSCLPDEDLGSCTVAHGTGIYRCEWSGDWTCLVQSCEDGWGGEDCAFDVVGESCGISHGNGALDVHGSCLVTSCGSSYYSTGSSCSALVVDAPAPAPSPQISPASDARGGSIAALAAILLSLTTLA